MTRAIERMVVVTAHPGGPAFTARGTVARLVKERRLEIAGLAA
jgi:hypothetical protein